MRPTDPKALKRKKRKKTGVSRRHPNAAVVLEPVLARDTRIAKGRERSAAPPRSPEARLEEALGLACAIDLVVRASGLVPLPRPRPATLFGSGKVSELEGLIRAEGAELVGALQDRDVKTSGVQGECGGEATDTGSGDDDLSCGHGSSLVSAE